TPGWSAEPSHAAGPDVSDVALDRASYQAGETARVTLGSRFAGTALVNVIGEHLIDSQEVEVGEGDTTIELEVTEDWGPGAYVTATVFRAPDGDAGRMPARAVGLAWLAVDTSNRTLKVSLDLPQLASPREELNIPLELDRSEET